MSLDSFFRLLDDEEADLKARTERARTELSELEQAAIRLAQVRETACTLAARDTPADATTPGQHTDPAQDAPRHERAADHEPSPTTRIVQPRSLGPVSDRIVTLLGSSDHSWKVRDIVVALGKPSPTYADIHSMRNKVLTLVDSGHVVRTGTGMYAAARATTKGDA